MKKPMFILRFGAERLIDLDREALGHLQDETEDIAGCILPIGILTIIMTDQSPTQLKDLYVNAAKELNDHAPVVAWDPASNDAAFDLRDFKQVKELLAEVESHHDVTLTPEKNNIETCTMSLDELIDKVGRTGRESLSSIEFARLEKLSKYP